MGLQLELLYRRKHVSRSDKKIKKKRVERLSSIDESKFFVIVFNLLDTNILDNFAKNNHKFLLTIIFNNKIKFNFFRSKKKLF